MLEIKPISKEIEIILIKIRFLLINNVEDYFSILKLIAECVYIYHGTLLPIEKKKELDIQLKGIILKEYLQNNFLDKDKCDSKTIRKELGWSVWTLRMVTEEILRCSIPQHNMKLTMNLAKQEVAGSDKKIKSIALQLGFSGTESFVRRFKKETGLTPTLYREKYNKR